MKSMRVHFRDPCLAVATWHNVQLQYFSGPLQRDHPEIICRVRDLLSAQNPGRPIYAMSVIPATIDLPERAARDASHGMLAYLNRTSAGSAYVIEGEGLRPSAMRTFVSVMLMASRAGHPTRVVPNVDVGVAWLVGALQCGLPPVELREVVAMLRRQRAAKMQPGVAGISG